EDVGAVHPLAVHAVGGGPLVQLGLGRRALHGGAHAEAVVHHDVDDRQVPQRGDVERLVERADVGGAVAHLADHHLVAAAVVDGERGAGGERDLAADDAVAAEHPGGGVVQVHRPAPALGRTGGATVELGHHAAGLDALGDR